MTNPYQSPEVAEPPSGSPGHGRNIFTLFIALVTLVPVNFATLVLAAASAESPDFHQYFFRGLFAVTALVFLAVVMALIRRLFLRWKRSLAIAAIAALCVYVGSFLLFRSFPYEFSLAHRDDPQHYVVQFTDNVEVHSAFRRFYWPLIQVMPGHRYYPSREEIQQARDAHEWWVSGTRPAEPTPAPDRGGR